MSKFGRAVIIINVVLTLIAFSIHGYNAYRLHESNQIILETMEEYQINRDIAIRTLVRNGEDLYLGGGMSYFGMFTAILTLYLLRQFYKSHGFFFGFFAAFCGFFTSYIGGILLFYALFSGKSEIGGTESGYSFRNEWEDFIHKKVLVMDAENETNE